MAEETERTSLEEAVAWFQARPEEDVIFWYSDHVRKDKPWSASWIDVQIPALEEELQWGWTLTLNSPEAVKEEPEFESADDLSFSAPQDHRVRRVYLPEEHWFDDDNAVVRAVGDPFTEEDEAGLQAILDAGEGRFIQEHGAWTASDVTIWLEDWVSEYAERPDIMFVWDPDHGPSPFLAEALETKKGVEAGEIPLIRWSGEELLERMDAIDDQQMTEQDPEVPNSGN